MSILTGPEIRRLAEGGVGPNGERIVITPFDPARCGPASYDVHLGDEMKVYDTMMWQHVGKFHREFVGHKTIDPLFPSPVVPAESDCDENGQKCWALNPGRVYLASTAEYTETHRLVPTLHGRSSIGRLGLFIHVTAGVGDPGFCGRWTLELVAVQPIIVRPGMKIGQLVYQTVTGEDQPYAGRYQGDTGTVASRFHLPDPKE
jgi:dCTP deaminase